MDQQAIIIDLEERAKAAGISIRVLCERAGIHPTTFSRWKASEKNPEPIGATLTSLRKLESALTHSEAQVASESAAA